LGGYGLALAALALVVLALMTATPQISLTFFSFFLFLSQIFSSSFWSNRAVHANIFRVV